MSKRHLKPHIPKLKSQLLHTHPKLGFLANVSIPFSDNYFSTDQTKLDYVAAIIILNILLSFNNRGLFLDIHPLCVSCSYNVQLLCSRSYTDREDISWNSASCVTERKWCVNQVLALKIPTYLLWVKEFTWPPNFNRTEVYYSSTARDSTFKETEIFGKQWNNIIHQSSIYSS